MARKIDPCLDHIREMRKADKQRPPKQRHAANNRFVQSDPVEASVLMSSLQHFYPCLSWGFYGAVDWHCSLVNATKPFV